MKQKKIIIVVPDGTGIKNYLFSDIIPKLIRSGSSLLIYHELSHSAISEVEQLHNIKLDTKKLNPYQETWLQKFYRESICYARLHYNSALENNKTILLSWRKKFTGIKWLFYKLVKLYGKQNSKHYSAIEKLENRYQKLLTQSISREITFLSQHRPDVIFCTHQRALKAIPVMKAAESLGIKTIGAIYSWDNVVKARLAVRTNIYLVWSELMKYEFKKYYPEISQDKIEITGTPQFDLYKKVVLKSKEEFFESYNLDINKLTICFSGDDVHTSPYDPNYLYDLATAVSNSSYSNYVQIIFRRCPVDLSKRYDKILEDFKDIIVPIEPKWSNTQAQWTQIYPLYKDVELLANICKHSDLVINVGSTMAHDFAYFGNAAAYLNYDTVIDNNWSVNNIYNYQHFKSMPHKNVVNWINSKDDYIRVINLVQNKPESLGLSWFQIINAPNLDSVQEITDILLK